MDAMDTWDRVAIPTQEPELRPCAPPKMVPPAEPLGL